MNKPSPIRTIPWLLLLGAVTERVSGQERDVFDLTIEELMNESVTSVAGVEQSKFRTPSAIHVITANDVKRAGHRKLAEALRLAPGMHVGRLDASRWAVTARGHNSMFSNKLLALVDGRSIYTPLYSGVFWDVNDVLLEDLDRIEVVRGPGSTLWGANAMNGVINVTTKSAKDTQGTYLSAATGTHDRAYAALRHGGTISENTWYRVWGSFSEHDSFRLSSGGEEPSDWSFAQGGIRLDSESEDARSTLILNLYEAPRIGEATSVIGNGKAHGGNLSMRREADFTSKDGGWSIQANLGRNDRDTALGFGYQLDLVELDLRANLRVSPRHELLAGVAYRRHDLEVRDQASIISFAKQNVDLGIAGAFLQDRITLTDNTNLMLGTKFEDNDFAGSEWQPSARLSHSFNDGLFGWLSVSRPVRTPSISENYISIPTGAAPPTFLTGHENILSEELLAYEAGLRSRFSDNLLIDLSLFFNDYSNLVDRPLNSSGLADGNFNNSGKAEYAGLEGALHWTASSTQRFDLSYSYLNRQNYESDGFWGTGGAFSAEHLLHLGSSTALSDRLQMDLNAYYASEILKYNLPAYFRLDAGLTWRPNDEWELRLQGENLVDAHPEFSENLFMANLVDVEPSVLLSVSRRF